MCKLKSHFNHNSSFLQCLPSGNRRETLQGLEFVCDIIACLHLLNNIIWFTCHNFCSLMVGKKLHAGGNLQSVITIIPYRKLPSACHFIPHHLAAKVVNQMVAFSKCKHAFLPYTNPKPWNVCFILAWAEDIYPYQDRRLHAGWW